MKSKKQYWLFGACLLALTMGSNVLYASTLFAAGKKTAAASDKESGEARSLNDSLQTNLWSDNDVNRLSEEQMRLASPLNFTNFMKGTVAGLQVLNSSSGHGGSVALNFRGQRSFTERSSPLILIDGIPFVNNRGEQPTMWGGLDEGDGLSQINPDDIASIEFVKGSSATILYGSEAANGLILITTKQAKESHLRVNLNSSTQLESVMSTPDLQFKYGTNGDQESWSTIPGDYEDNYVSDYFKTGLTAMNSLSISGGSKQSKFYASYANTSSKGVVENNRYQRNNFALRNNSSFFQNRLKLRAGVSYAEETVKNRYATGYYLNPLTGLYLFPRNGATPANDYTQGIQPFSYFKQNYLIPDQYTGQETQNWFVEGDHMQSNPYWVMNRQPQEDKTTRWLANVAVSYALSDDFGLDVRSGYDYADKSFEQRYYAGGNPVNIGTNGRWRYKSYTDKQFFLDGAVYFQHQFNKLGLVAALGANYLKSEFYNGEEVDSGISGLTSPNIFNADNLPSRGELSELYAWDFDRKGFYGTLDFNYDQKLQLELGLRNDITSSVASEGNESHWYTSVKLATQLNNWLDLPASVENAQVYASATRSYRGLASSVMHLYQIAQLSPSTSVEPIDDLKAEKISSWELGTNWDLWQNRLSVDLAYYQITNSDQAYLSNWSANGNSFYQYHFINLGDVVNKGLELVLSATPVNHGRFNWQTTVNFSTNKNEVKEIFASESDRPIDFGSSEGYYSYVFNGGAFGDLYGRKFQRNDEGTLLLDEETGRPLIAGTNRPEYLGNLNPDWMLGWTNTFNYRDFSLNLLVNANVGGKAYSQTESMLDGFGVSRRTAEARDRGSVAINALQGTTPVNQIDPELYYTTVGGRQGISENYVYDRTNIRLAQVALSYAIDVEKLGLPLQAASVSLMGNNLFFLYKKAPFDPELAMNTGLNYQSLDNFSVPAIRMYGFNLKVTF